MKKLDLVLISVIQNIKEAGKNPASFIPIIFVIMIILFFHSCSESTQPDTIAYCKMPEYYLKPSWLPVVYGDGIIGLSKDGNKLAFWRDDLVILTLPTMKFDKYTSKDLQKLLPINIKLIGISQVFWAPYNNDKMLLNLYTDIDTIGDGKNYHKFQNLYFFDINEMRLERITPNVVGPYGMPDKSFLTIGPMINSSTFIDNDSLQIGINYFHELGKPRKPGSGRYIYIPQTQELIPPRYTFIEEISHDGRYVFWQDTFIINKGWKKSINSKELFNGEFPVIDFASFSPKDEKLALSIQLEETGTPIQLMRFREIWILNVNKFMYENRIDFKIINLRRDFCMYADNGFINAEFISDSTLAVSMHKADTFYAFLYEITLDGRILRQLTFEP